MSPKQLTADGTQYVVMVDFGRHGREAIVHPEDTRAGLVDQIYEQDGEGSSIAWVHAYHPEEGWSRDISEDVTREIVDRCLENLESLPHQISDLAAKFYGPEYVDDFDDMIEEIIAENTFDPVREHSTHTRAELGV